MRPSDFQHVSSWVALVLLSGLRTSFAEPFSFPLPNGFPFPSEEALEELFTRAGGNFTNAPLAPRFDDDSLTSWKLQAFNEFMEVAFFTQLIANITNGVPGYQLDSASRGYILSTLETIQAQEQMHAYNANDAVRYFTNGTHMLPCTYQFPVSDFPSAVALAQTFTDMYIGLLANVQQRTAASLGRDAGPIVYVLAQALGQEGQQSGWFRSLRRRPPSAEPFLTSSTRELALGWLQRFIVPGSCPNAGEIPLRVLPALDVVRVDGADSAGGRRRAVLRAPGPVDAGSQSLALVNGALVPTVVSFDVQEVLGCGGGPQERLDEVPLTRLGGDERQGACVVSTLIAASIPYARNVMHGMVLAAIVQDGPTFITAEDVTNSTVYGPAVIELS